MSDRERYVLNVEMDKPVFYIGQTVFIPRRGGPIATEVTGYISLVKGSQKDGLVSRVRSFQVNPFGIERIGSEVVSSDELSGINFCIDERDAQAKSRFLDVVLDDESWKLAIGDRDAKDDSPYSLQNCNLPPCCEDISEVRDILYLCRKQNGLIDYDLGVMTGLIFDEHTLNPAPGSPLDSIFKQLEVSQP